MIRFCTYLTLAIGLFVVPWYIIFVCFMVYTWWWGGLEIVFLGILFDWLFVPTYPIMTLLCLMAVVLAQLLRRV